MYLILERKGGVPNEANIVELDAHGEVTINNQKYNLTFDVSSALEKVSSTQVKEKYFVNAKDETGAEVSLTPAQLKGQKVSITINKVFNFYSDT